MNKFLALLLWYSLCNLEIVSCFVLQYAPTIPHPGSARPSSFLTEDSVAAETTGTIEAFPYCVSVSKTSDSWIREATRHLQENGVCVLVTTDDEERLIDAVDCRAANDAAASRLSKLKEHIKTNRDVDPDDETFRFLEVVSRDENGGRYDMSISWKNEQDFGGIPLTTLESQSITKFHESLENVVQPVIESLWSNPDTPNVAASGFLINQPGSTDQNWHRDGPNEGWINVFCPLVDLTREMGPTEVWSQTHLSTNQDNNNNNKMIPFMKQGQILLMDYRTFHRGLGNTSRNTTRTVSYAVYHKGMSSLGDKLSYGLLPTAYQSIEQKGVNAQIVVPFSVRVNTDSDEWTDRAALNLEQEGVCVLYGQEEEQQLFDENTCQDVNKIAFSRLEDLQKRIANRGMDPDGTFQFLEVVCSEEGRYDMPISWKDHMDSCIPFATTRESNIVTKFHTRIQEIVKPVMDKLWTDEGYRVTSCGFIIHHPGSSHQPWQRDGCEEGTIHIFVPLMDLTKDMGLTEVWPKSHVPTNKEDAKEKVAPLLKQGQILLMDDRTLWQSMGNEASTWTMAYVTLQKESLQTVNHKVSSAMTLEYD